jgi:putative endonuclease
MSHFFYLARCTDGSLYAGTCIDVAAREEMHNSGKGAKYTRSRLPIKIVYTETFETLSEARKREAAVKRLTKPQKEKLLRASPPRMRNKKRREV